MDDGTAPEYTARLGLDNLAGLMEQQLELLRRIDQRQAAAGNSTWGALLQSRVADTIQPKVDRWRNGLDALLIFLGLFSGVVTAFLVNSFAGLQPDELGGSPTLKIVDPAPFQPDAVSVRLNSLWSLSLILSVIFAILALHLLPTPIAAASALSLFFVIGIVAFLAAAPLHAALRPASSPFQSPLARFIRRYFTAATLLHAALWPAFQSTLARFVHRSFIVATAAIATTTRTPPWEATDFAETYHEMVQATHDDATLDKAAAALSDVLRSPEHWFASDERLALIHDSGAATLVHLLSPEVSPRCNQTAAQVIVSHANNFLWVSPRHSLALTQLPDNLAHAAPRSANYRSLAVLWSSNYIHALAIVAGVSNPARPPVISLLGSTFTSRSTRIFTSRRTRDLLFDVFFDYYDKHAASPDGPPPRALIQLFEPYFVDARQILVFVLYLEHGYPTRARLLIVLLMAAKSPSTILDLAHDLFLPDAGHPESLEDKSALLIAPLVIYAYLASDAKTNPDPWLEQLCTACKTTSRPGPTVAPTTTSRRRSARSRPL
ncbi:hypothetical protein B0H11DRAFT_2230523 [Mycena galericulata]|nr:hypothetical protein B0H11DRAFT_2230523 [Mycena galericulata]